MQLKEVFRRGAAVRILLSAKNIPDPHAFLSPALHGPAALDARFHLLWGYGTKKPRRRWQRIERDYVRFIR